MKTAQLVDLQSQKQTMLFLNRKAERINDHQVMRKKYSLPLCNASNIDKCIRGGGDLFCQEYEAMMKPIREEFAEKNPLIQLTPLEMPNAVDIQKLDTIKDLDSTYTIEAGMSDFNICTNSNLLDFDPVTGMVKLGQRGLAEIEKRLTFGDTPDSKEAIEISAEFEAIIDKAQKFLTKKGITGDVLKNFLVRVDGQYKCNPRIFKISR